MGLKPATNPDIEAATIELSIDGRMVSAKDGVSLYDVIASTGKIVPAMCYHYTFDPSDPAACVWSCRKEKSAGSFLYRQGRRWHG